MNDQQKQRRTIRKDIRWTATEFQTVTANAAAANADVSDFVRSCALNKKPKPSSQATGDRATALQILADFGKMRGLVKQVGDNLNNIARSGNRQRQVTEESVLLALKEIESLGDIFRNLLNQSRP